MSIGKDSTSSHCQQSFSLQAYLNLDGSWSSFVVKASLRPTSTPKRRIRSGQISWVVPRTERSESSVTVSY